MIVEFEIPFGGRGRPASGPVLFLSFHGDGTISTNVLLASDELCGGVAEVREPDDGYWITFPNMTCEGLEKYVINFDIFGSLPMVTVRIKRDGREGSVGQSIDMQTLVILERWFERFVPL